MKNHLLYLSSMVVLAPEAGFPWGSILVLITSFSVVWKVAYDYAMQKTSQAQLRKDMDNLAEEVRLIRCELLKKK